MPTAAVLSIHDARIDRRSSASSCSRPSPTVGADAVTEAVRSSPTAAQSILLWPRSTATTSLNGASHYAGLLAALAALETRVDLQAVPSGLIRKIARRDGDASVVVSVSGEFRDLVDAVAEDLLPRPLVVVTAMPASTLAQAADAIVPLAVEEHDTETHPQDFCTAAVACLALLARLSKDDVLRELVERTPVDVAAAAASVEDWLPALERPEAAVCAGHGAAWAGALELALLLKEIARIPAE